MKQGPLGVRLRILYKQLIQTPPSKDGLHINAEQARECVRLFTHTCTGWGELDLILRKQKDAIVIVVRHAAMQNLTKL